MDIKTTPIKDTEEYKQLTTSLEKLEQQRKNREDDIEKLKLLYKEALESPIEFLEKLISGSIRLPAKQSIEPVPVIANLGNNLLKRKILVDDYIVSSESFDIPCKEESLSTTNSATTTTTSSSSSSSSSKSKEHLYYDPSFNRPWSAEEQTRLEELLDEFPEEAIASHRWAKIANALGNRTLKQVASRTQKYFVKLHKLGLPIPGKPPNPPSLNPKPPMRKKKRPSNHDSSSSTSTSSSKKKKENNKLSSSTASTSSTVDTTTSSLPIHEGYKCDGCDAEPIIGTRWRCEECLEIDLCNDCNSKYEEIGSHKSSHHMTSYDTVDLYYFQDEDYKFSYTGGDANYLDTNYSK